VAAKIIRDTESDVPSRLVAQEVLQNGPQDGTTHSLLGLVDLVLVLDRPNVLRWQRLLMIMLHSLRWICLLLLGTSTIHVVS